SGVLLVVPRLEGDCRRCIRRAGARHDSPKVLQRLLFCELRTRGRRDNGRRWQSSVREETSSFASFLALGGKRRECRITRCSRQFRPTFLRVRFRARLGGITGRRWLCRGLDRLAGAYGISYRRQAGAAYFADQANGGPVREPLCFV